jgi:hypothetical protein
MTNTAIKVASNSADEALRQKLRSTTTSLLKQYFGQTLNTVPDIVNIFMALMLKESHFNVNAAYATALSPYNSSGAADYYNSTVIKNILTPGNPASSLQKRDNEPEGRTAIGLTQCMGWNIVKGASISGKCLVEQFRPDLVGTLCINPGDSVKAKLSGEANISNSILAGLVVLESKYRAGYAKNGGWAIKLGSGKSSRELQFPSRIYSSVAGYLGYSSAGDANHTTYTGYANDIVGGSFYAAANGTSAPRVVTTKIQTAMNSSNGPVTVGGVGMIPGCVAIS